VLSLVGTERISLNLATMLDGQARGEFAVALTLDALYEVLEGKVVNMSRSEGEIRLCPDGDQLIIERESVKLGCASYRVWMTELALAWNMLAGNNPRREEGHALRFQ
jgi:hypothetical protein